MHASPSLCIIARFVHNTLHHPRNSISRKTKMSTYGISKINWATSHAFVNKVLVHRASKDQNGQIGWDFGETMIFHEVATLIDRGDQVYVLIPDGPGCFKHTDKIRIKPHQQQEHLESIDEVGNPTSSLYDLPTWLE